MPRARLATGSEFSMAERNMDQFEQCLPLIRSNYRRILALYYQLASASVTGDGKFGVSSIGCTELIDRAKLLKRSIENSQNEAQILRADVSRLFFAAVHVPQELESQFAVLNKRGLNRSQFTQFLIRIADLIYVQTGNAKTLLEALDLLFKTEVGRLMDEQCTRMENFIKASGDNAVDDVCKTFLGQLQAFYKKYSVVLHGKAPFVSLKAWEEMLQALGAHKSSFSLRQTAFAFRMGMMTKPDEYFSSRFIEMSFVEFLMGLCAVVYLQTEFDPDSIAKSLGSNLEDFLTMGLR